MLEARASQSRAARDRSQESSRRPPVPAPSGYIRVSPSMGRSEPSGVIRWTYVGRGTPEPQCRIAPATASQPGSQSRPLQAMMGDVLMICDVCDDPVDYEATVTEVDTGHTLKVGLCEAHLDLLDAPNFRLRDGTPVTASVADQPSDARS